MTPLIKIAWLPLLLWGGTVYAQPGNPAKKDTLLWFIGKWQSKTVFKADSNYLTGGAANSTVTIGSDGSPSVQSGDGQKFNQQIDDGVGSVDNLKQQFQQSVTTEGLGQYHLLAFSESAMDSVKAFFQRLKVQQSASSNPPGFSSILAQDCIDKKPDYDAVIQFWQAHKGNKNEHYDYPPPPQADYFNCWSCHRDLQTQFAQDCQSYTASFFQPEDDLINKAQAILRKLALMGIGDEGGNLRQDGTDFQSTLDSLFHKSKKDPSKNGPCAYLDTYNLTQALGFLAMRLGKKADQLYKDVKNQHNFNSLIPMVMVNATAYSQMLKLGFGSTDAETARLSGCGQLAHKLVDTLEDLLFKEHDYAYIANIPLMFEMRCQSEVLGGSADGQSDPYLFRLNDALKFKLSLEMDIKTNLHDKGNQYAHLKGDANVAVELDSTSCVRFILSKQENGKMTMNVLYNGMILPKCQPEYTGTRTYAIALPEMNLHFCKAAADTLTLTRMTPDPVGADTWVNPCDGSLPPMKMGINGLDGYFMDPAAIVKQAQAIKANAGPDRQQLEAMKAQAEAMKQQFASGGGGGMNSPDMAANIKKMMDLGNNLMNTQVADIGRLIIPVTVQNKSKTLIDQRIDAKVVNSNPKIQELIAYGYLTIQLKNTSQSGN